MIDNDQIILTASQKAEAALECARGKRPIGDIAASYGVDVAQLQRWECALTAHAASLFEDNGGAAVAQLAVQQMRVNEALIFKVFEHTQAEDALRESTRMLQQLLAHQEDIKEEERKRIAREIHDDLGQNLLAVRIDISMLHARTGGRHPRLHQRVGLALDNIDVTIKSIRSIINDLRPFELELGLQAAVEWQLRRFERLSGIACHLSADAMCIETELGDAPTLAVFRILQESLSNIARHARARKVEVVLGCSDAMFSMTVADDGVGVGPDSRRKANSFGLVGISERISALGGKFNVDSGDAGGTVLSISLPLLA